MYVLDIYIYNVNKEHILNHCFSENIHCQRNFRGMREETMNKVANATDGNIDGVGLEDLSDVAGG